MPVAGFIAVLLIAFVIGAIFYYAFKTTGPWGSFWTFFLIVFFGVYLTYIWARPIGPVYWGVAFFPLIFIGLLFALLLAAATPPSRGRGYIRRNADTPLEDRTELPEEEETTLGIFFWTAIILFVALLIAGIYY